MDHLRKESGKMTNSKVDELATLRKTNLNKEFHGK